MRKRNALTLLLAISLPVLAAQWQSRIDLNQFLIDPKALHQLTIRYTSAERRGQGFYIHGDGRLMLQQLPRERGVWNSLVPTCTTRVSEDTIRGLVNLLIEKAFFDLPEKRFFFLYASDDPEPSPSMWST